MKYLVYQRRSLVDVLRTQAIMAAYLSPQQAADLAKQYLEAAIPTDPEALERMREALEKEVAAIAAMGPIPVSAARFTAH
ncbi:MAG TPA: hypothetical protein VLH09_09565 [Bryobacteraceae bacterium]|nr:hypothetical protein [Bryobacteraceae bacterium]